MRVTKRILSLCLTLALIVLVPVSSGISASAEDTKTFHVKYVPDLGEWRVQLLPAWDDSRETGDFNFLFGNLAENDAIVVYGSDHAFSITIPKAFGNLTLVGGTGYMVVYAEQPIKDVYAIQGCTAAINGDVGNVYVYDNCSVNINNNAKNVYITGESKMEMNVAAIGTVDMCQITDLAKNVTTMYNVQAGALKVEKGANKTDAQKYSTAPGAAPAKPAAKPASSGGNAASSGATSPKTGEGFLSLLLLAGSAACLTGSCALRRRKAD